MSTPADTNFNEKHKNLLYYSPKLGIKDSEDGFCQKALEKILNTELGKDLLDSILQNPALKALNIEYSLKSSHAQSFRSLHIFNVYLSKKDTQKVHYITQINGQKFIGPLFTADHLLYHELIHVFHTLNDDGFVARAFILPSNRDFKNKEEKRTILATNAYLATQDLPPRSDDFSIEEKPSESGTESDLKSLMKEKIRKTEYDFYDLIRLGLREAFLLCNRAPDQAIKIIEQSLQHFLIQKGADFQSDNATSECMNDLFYEIIKSKKLLEHKNWSTILSLNLLTIYLCNIQTLDQFKKLEELFNDYIDIQKFKKIENLFHECFIKNHYIHWINRSAKEYVKIITYLKNEKQVDIDRYNEFDCPLFLKKRYSYDDLQALLQLNVSFNIQFPNRDSIASLLDFTQSNEMIIKSLNFLKSINVYIGVNIVKIVTYLDNLELLLTIDREFDLISQDPQKILSGLNPFGKNFYEFLQILTLKNVDMQTLDISENLNACHISSEQRTHLEKLGIYWMYL